MGINLAPKTPNSHLKGSFSNFSSLRQQLKLYFRRLSLLGQGFIAWISTIELKIWFRRNNKIIKAPLLSVCLEGDDIVFDKKLLATLYSLAYQDIYSVEVLLFSRSSAINLKKAFARFGNLHIRIFNFKHFQTSNSSSHSLSSCALGEFVISIAPGAIFSPKLTIFLAEKLNSFSNETAFELDEIFLEKDGFISDVWLSRKYWSADEISSSICCAGRLLRSSKQGCAFIPPPKQILGLQGCWIQLPDSDGELPGQFVSQIKSSSDSEQQVTIVIPTIRSCGVDGKPYVMQLLNALTFQTGVSIDVLLVDAELDSITFYANMIYGSIKSLRVVPFFADGEKFNFSAKVNAGIAASSSEFILLLNDDLRPLTTNSIAALVKLVSDSKVGVAGAQLLFPNGQLQHAGVITGLGRPPFHPRHGIDINSYRLKHWLAGSYEVSAVIGAVMAFKRSNWERIKGFDERLTVEFNDIDFCLRLRNLGLVNVYTGAAIFEHHEKASRGSRAYLEVIKSDKKLFSERWQKRLLSDPNMCDPNMHPWLHVRDVHKLLPAWRTSAVIEIYCRRLKIKANTLYRRLNK